MEKTDSIEIVYFYGCRNDVGLDFSVDDTGIAAAAVDVSLGSCIVNVGSRFVGLVFTGTGSKYQHGCRLSGKDHVPDRLRRRQPSLMETPPKPSKLSPNPPRHMTGSGCLQQKGKDIGQK
ncbi:hypothetical protein V6N13_131408 [Hibiscus sabdariffa]|uniref:Uncharacterized protein n=1 Tax=Hibiscus sabdariffa TaxID=183260 RepID=A0ABR2D7S7_9ROSI